MKIGKPLTTQIPSLKLLWKEAFGDTDEFIDIFFSTAFSTNRCRCVTLNGNIIAALYWFNCQYNNKPIAYLYAVATAKAYRGQGICHTLMKDTHQHLAQLGYEGVILVPGNEGLFKFYENIGYKTCSYIHKFQCSTTEDIIEFITENTVEGTIKATTENLERTKYINQVESINNTKNSNNVSKIQLLSISKNEYGKLRRQLMPENSVIQENENLDFLQTQAKFYTGFYEGNRFLLAGREENNLFLGIELLGDWSVAPKLLKMLEYEKGIFRTPPCDAGNIPFAMFFVLHDNTLPAPEYFGLAYD